LKPPNFFLASSDGYLLEAPRKCWRIHQVVVGNRRDALLVRIAPPLEGDSRTSGADEVVLVPRHREASLFPVNEWPLYVYVVIPLVDIRQQSYVLSESNSAIAAWAELYRSQEDALARATV
jgi:hypothetical protein